MLLQKLLICLIRLIKSPQRQSKNKLGLSEKLNLKQIADYLDGKIIGNEDCEVRNILPLDLANEDDFFFI